MAARHHDDSIEHEPHLRGGDFAVDPSEAIVSAQRRERDEQAEFSVFDEPTFSEELAPAAPADRVTYATLLASKRASTSWAKSWGIMLLMAIAAGPMAVAGTFITNASSGAWGVMTVIVAAPLIEEVMKIALPLWVVERKPWLFITRVQLAVTAVAGGFVFAVIENLLYIHVYLDNPSASLIAWRWTVCVMLHVVCVLISSLGLMKVWSTTWRTGRRPDISLAARHITIAMVIHGLYNLLATLIEFTGYAS